MGSRRVNLAVLLSPAAFVTAWTFAIAVTVLCGVPLSSLWGVLWLATMVAAAIGVFLLFRHWRAFDPVVLVVPAFATIVVMMPYLIHGIASFPGSWFWDGFAYMAAGESLWLRPRYSDVAGLELFYQFGQHIGKGRYVSSSFISLFKGVVPIGGDAQEAMGYFLFLCVFTFASSCAFLAMAALPGRRTAQVWFTAMATFSGPLLNLIWANNFDHLLAASLAPVVLGVAFILRWGRVLDAALFGVVSAAILYIYPEMAPVFLLPAGLVLFWRMMIEERSIDQAKSAIVAVCVFGVLVIPAWPDLLAFVQGQIAATKVAVPGLRPGNGYFPTFFSGLCGAGAWFGLFHPFEQCGDDIGYFLKFAIGVGCWVVLVTVAWRSSLAVAVGVILVAAGYFLVVQRYDYGAFKILETGWVPLLLLVFIGAARSRPRAIFASPMAAALLLVASARLGEFDQMVQVKSVAPFAELHNAIPPGVAVEVRIDDPLAFQWATYYLRDASAIFTSGELVYFAPPVAVSASNAKFLLTDKELAEPAMWSNKVFHLYVRP